MSNRTLTQDTAKKWTKPRQRSRIFSTLRSMPLFPLAIVVALVVCAVFANPLAPYQYNAQDLYSMLKPGFWANGWNGQHLLGTDQLGRDLLSRIIYGARISLTLSIIAVIFSGFLGTVVGLLSAYYGGTIDSLLMRLVDIGLSLPMILVAIVLAAVVGASYTNVIIIIAVLLWPRYARQIRGEALAVKEQDFVALARVAGASNWRIMIRHFLPNLIPTLLVLATLQVGYVIILESSLSFLGVGIPPPLPAWGLMVADGKGYLQTAWWISVFPGIAILLTVLALNLLGDWTRDKLDPKLRQV